MARDVDIGSCKDILSATLIDDKIAEVLNDYVAIGSGAPSIKMKKLTGTTGSSEGDATTIAHGLTLSKIIGYHILVDNASGNKIPPAFTSVAEFEYDGFIDGTNVNIHLHATNSGSIKSKAISVLITYEE